MSWESGLQRAATHVAHDVKRSRAEPPISRSCAPPTPRHAISSGLSRITASPTTVAFLRVGSGSGRPTCAVGRSSTLRTGMLTCDQN